jgi:hypothetical protein
MRTNLIAAAVGAAGLVGSAVGQCPQPQWRSLASVPGVHGVAECAVEWDPDGPGPRGTLLVVGGVFDSAGDVVTRKIAAWDGERWTDELGGFTTYKHGGVSELMVRQGQLLAAVRSVTDSQGAFLPGLQAWNGSAWSPVEGAPESCWSMVEYGGGIAVAADTGVHLYAAGQWTAVGLTSGPSTGDARVTGLALDTTGALLAGGGFTSIEGVPVNGLARWDGSAWSDFGLPEGANCGGVAVFEGSVIASARTGTVHPPTYHLLRRIGSVWEPLSAPEVRPFRPLVVDSELYLLNLPLNQWGGTGPLWRLQGDSWEQVGLPLRGGSRFVLPYRGELVVGGSPMGDGATAFSGVARLVNDQWRAFGEGLSGVLWDVEEFNGALHVSGQWMCGPTGPGVQRLVNGGWEAVPGFDVDGEIEEYQGSLIGPAADGSGWLKYDGVTVSAMAPPPGYLPRPRVVGGVLYGVSWDWMHRLDGQTWTQIAELDRFYHPGVDPVLHNGLLHARSIQFDGPVHSGAGPASYDGAEWTFMGYFPSNLSVYDQAMCSFNGSLFLGGAFYEWLPGGGSLRHGVLRWTGETWAPLAGTPEPLGVLRLGAAGHRMIASGGNDTTVGLLAWDQSRWRWLAAVTDWTWTTRGVERWVEHGDELVIAGHFGTVNGTAAHMIAAARIDPCCGSADFDGDGSPGTDADIEAFFACLAGRCCEGCGADFDDDGDTGTDADIEAFFRVLAGGAC